MARSATVFMHALKFGGDEHHPMELVNGILTKVLPLAVTEIAPPVLMCLPVVATSDKSHPRGRSKTYTLGQRCHRHGECVARAF